jgi:hypothetical protein
MFDHFIICGFNQGYYPLTEFAEHIINLTVLQTLFGRWPLLIMDKMHIMGYMNAG